VARKERFGGNTECRQPCKSGEMVCIAVPIATAVLWSSVAPYQSGVRFIVAFKVHSESLFGLLAMSTLLCPLALARSVGRDERPIDGWHARSSTMAPTKFARSSLFSQLIYLVATNYLLDQIV